MSRCVSRLGVLNAWLIIEVIRKETFIAAQYIVIGP